METLPVSFEFLRGALSRRLVFLGVLFVLLQVPVSSILRLVRERGEDLQDARSEVAWRWGGPQAVIGPVLVVPYQRGASTHTASFLPSELNVEGKLDSTPQRNGIYQVPAYRIGLTLEGVFEAPDFAAWDIEPESIFWDQAILWTHISDVHVLRSQTRLAWNGADLDFQPGTGGLAQGRSGIHVPLRHAVGTAKRYEFQLELVLDGTESCSIAPLGDRTSVHLISDWPTPEFQGTWLPLASTSGPKGFDASWSVSSLGRSYPSHWFDEPASMRNALEGSLIGVKLQAPANIYGLAQDTAKHRLLCLLLPLLILWGLESWLRLRVHSLHYALVGLAMVLFYLLELTLTEVLGFDAGYGTAAAAVACLVGSHCFGVLGTWRRGLLVGSCIGAMYGYLYFSLVSQDGALLATSIGLFFLLALVMAMTQKIQWPDPFTAAARPAQPESDTSNPLSTARSTGLTM